jgi:pilus assembly protein Flp/PilA
MTAAIASMWQRRSRVAAEEDGQGLVEYSLILLLVAVVVVVILTMLGVQTSHLYSNVSSGMGP